MPHANTPVITPLEPRVYPALFLDGWSADERAVRVEVHASSLRIVSAADVELASWQARGLSVDAMLEGGVVHATHKDAPQETLVVSDAELAERLLVLAPRAVLLPGGEHKLRFVLSCLLALAVLAGAFYLATPRIAHFIAVRISLEKERALGAQVEGLIALARCDAPEAKAVLDEMVGKLAGRGAPHYATQLLDEHAPNAFALPGGLILVTTGLLREAESADEIAGVLAHEVEHIEQRHVLAGFVRDAIFTGLWSLTLGDYAGLLVVDPSTAYRVANLRFSRDDEQAADRGAVSRLHAVGASHRGLTEFFARLASEAADVGPEWLSTHPPTSERIAELERTHDVSAARALITSAQFEALKSACKEAP